MGEYPDAAELEEDVNRWIEFKRAVHTEVLKLVAGGLDGANLERLTEIANNAGLDPSEFLGVLATLQECDRLDEEVILDYWRADHDDEFVLPASQSSDAFPTPEIKENPEQIIETAERGSASFAPGVLVRDKIGQLATVVSFEIVPDKTDYPRDDPSIRHPDKYTNPLITIQYPDGRQAQIDIDTPLTAVYDRAMPAIKAGEPGFNESHLEIRNHDYQLGELVSFGHQIGTLAVIYPDHQTVGISAREVWGKQTPRHLYRVDIDKIDYIERVDGDLKKNPDGTIYKPTLGGHDS